MIRGVHTMFYSSQAEALRVFIRDVLGWTYTDVGEGWLIFDAPEADMGVHPSDETQPHARAGKCGSVAVEAVGLPVAFRDHHGGAALEEAREQPLPFEFAVEGDA